MIAPFLNDKEQDIFRRIAEIKASLSGSPDVAAASQHVLKLEDAFLDYLADIRAKEVGL